MKVGKYFRIPQGPSDLEILWEGAEPLAPADLPLWLTPDTAAEYRLVGRIVWDNSPGDAEPDYSAELAELESAGFVIEEEARDPFARRIYMKAPRKEPVWSIGIYRGDSPFQLAPAQGANNPVLTADDVTDVSASFVADPFMLDVNGTWHMFFEVMNWQRNVGEIGHAVSADCVRWSYQGIVLSEPFHLSYPCVFLWQNDYYMIPESFQAGGVRLYRADAFPTTWRCIATLLEGPYLVDASVFHRRGKWWMFVDTSPEMSHDTLRLYHADHLQGPWVEHPASPLKQDDPSNSRPAGRVLVVHDRVFRLAQCSLPFYGSEVRAFEIRDLTTTTYHEREAGGGAILKGSGVGWNACGMHHLDAHLQRDARWVACVDGWQSDEILRTLGGAAQR
jgi:hypothetical protein